MGGGGDRHFIMWGDGQYIRAKYTHLTVGEGQYIKCLFTVIIYSYNNKCLPEFVQLCIFDE